MKHYQIIPAHDVKLMVRAINERMLAGTLTWQQYAARKENILSRYVAVSHQPHIANLFVI